MNNSKLFSIFLGVLFIILICSDVRGLSEDDNKKIDDIIKNLGDYRNKVEKYEISISDKVGFSAEEINNLKSLRDNIKFLLGNVSNVISQTIEVKHMDQEIKSEKLLEIKILAKEFSEKDKDLVTSSESIKLNDNTFLKKYESNEALIERIHEKIGNQILAELIKEGKTTTPSSNSTTTETPATSNTTETPATTTTTETPATSTTTETPATSTANNCCCELECADDCDCDSSSSESNSSKSDSSSSSSSSSESNY